MTGPDKGPPEAAKARNIGLPEPEFGVHAEFGVRPNSINVSLAQTTISHSLIDPATLAELKQIDPEALSLVYRMVERQQIHDHGMDVATLKAEHTYRSLGLFAGVVALAILAIPSAVAFWFGHPTSGLVLGLLAAAASVAGVFVQGRNLVRMADAPAPERLQPAYPTQPVPTQAPIPPR